MKHGPYVRKEMTSPRVSRALVTFCCTGVTASSSAVEISRPLRRRYRFAEDTVNPVGQLARKSRHDTDDIDASQSLNLLDVISMLILGHLFLQALLPAYDYGIFDSVVDVRIYEVRTSIRQFPLLWFH